MKRLGVILVVAVAYTTMSMAQDINSALDYIYSEDGFKVRVGTVPSSPVNYEYTGLYSVDNSVFVSATYAYNNAFYVIYGTEVIAPYAFHNLKPYSTNSTYIEIYLPSTVKYIAPQALVRNDNVRLYFYTYDGCIEKPTSGKPTLQAQPDATETARYNIEGTPLNQPTNGVNLIRMSDGTTQKQLVK